MKKQRFDYKKLLEDFLNESIVDAAVNTHLNMKHQKLDTFSYKMKQKNKEFEKLYDLMSKENYIDESKFYESYLFAVADNKLKVVQFNENYLLDELLVIQNFLKTVEINKFIENLKKCYWASKKTQNKYIKKSTKKNIDTIYSNYKIGANILNYIYDKKNCNLLGDRYGLENHILDNISLEDEEILNHSYILVMNFDYNIIELYDSIPYELLQKGTAQLEKDSIYGCYFDDFNYQTFFDKINEWHKIN